MAVALAALSLGLLSRPVHAERYTFRAYTEAEGLGNPNVSSLLDDADGYLWVGTEHGLFRFEGSRFRRFGSSDGVLDRGGFVNNLYRDRAGHIWAGTQSGLYVLRGERFEPVPAGDGPFKINPNSSLTELPDGRILAVSLRRLMEIRPSGDGWSADSYFARHPLPGFDAATPVLSVGADAQGRAWFGCGPALCRLDGGTVTVWNPDRGVPEDDWYELLAARDGTLWARGRRHVRALPPGAEHFEDRDGALPAHAAPERYLLTLAQDPQGRIVTATDAGLARWHDGGWEFLDARQGFSPFPILDLLFDREGSPWLGVAGHGLVRWLGADRWSHWTPQDGLQSPIVWSIDEDRRGQLWVATQRGVDRIDSASGRLQPWQGSVGDHLRGILFIRGSRDGHVWLASDDGRLIEHDPDRETERVYPAMGQIRDLFADAGGSVWIATAAGLYRADSRRRSVELVLVPGFESSVFHQVLQQPGGTLLAVADTGLFRRPAGAAGWQRVEIGDALPTDPFPRFAMAADGSLWAVDAARQGLRRLWLGAAGLERAEFHAFADLADSQITFLQTDIRGWVWIGTDKGVVAFDGRRWKRFTRDDGLLWNDCDLNAFHAGADGSVWIGTSEGVSRLRDPLAAMGQPPPQVRLSSVRWGGRSQTLPSPRPLAPAGSPLSLEFAALPLSLQQGRRFRYRLAGLEQDWEEGSDAGIRYPALPSGAYEFQLQLLDRSRGMASPVLSMPLVVAAPWWATTLFRLAAAGLAVLLLVATMRLMLRLRTRVMTMRQLKLQRLVQQRTRELRRDKRVLLETREALRVQADRDHLTGLPNRRAVLELLQQELENQPTAGGAVVVVALLDIDHFKRFNDDFGHHVGDEVLCEVARRLRTALLPYLPYRDRVGRYGGEEFLIVMAGFTPETAAAALRAAHEAVSAAPVLVDGSSYRATCSIGVARTQAGRTAADSLIRAADAALYRAKNAGRNRIEYAG